MYNEPSDGENWDKRYYGVYRGIVVDAEDPEKKNRIKLKVPQILGSAVTNWAWPMGGEITQKAVPYGAFQSTITQTAVSTTSTNVMTFNTTDFSSGVYLNGNNDIRIERTGIYNLQWSGQFENNITPVSEYDVTVWLRQNGVDIIGSAGLVSIPQKHGTVPGHALVGWNYFLEFAAGDTLQFVWNASHAGITLKSYAASGTIPLPPVIPSTASVIATVNLIGNALPSPEDGCWVMFEGGDPNFPLWQGAY